MYIKKITTIFLSFTNRAYLDLKGSQEPQVWLVFLVTKDNKENLARKVHKDVTVDQGHQVTLVPQELRENEERLAWLVRSAEMAKWDFEVYQDLQVQWVHQVTMAIRETLEHRERRVSREVKEKPDLWEYLADKGCVVNQELLDFQEKEVPLVNLVVRAAKEKTAQLVCLDCQVQQALRDCQEQLVKRVM